MGRCNEDGSGEEGGREQEGKEAGVLEGKWRKVRK